VLVVLVEFPQPLNSKKDINKEMNFIIKNSFYKV
jgi:hypothetical protein